MKDMRGTRLNSDELHLQSNLIEVTTDYHTNLRIPNNFSAELSCWRLETDSDIYTL